MIKYFIIYFREVLRVIDSLQLTAQKKVATPVDWQVKRNLSRENLCKFSFICFFLIIVFLS